MNIFEHNPHCHVGFISLHVCQMHEKFLSVYSQVALCEVGLCHPGRHLCGGCSPLGSAGLVVVVGGGTRPHTLCGRLVCAQQYGYLYSSHSSHSSCFREPGLVLGIHVSKRFNLLSEKTVCGCCKLPFWEHEH